MYRVLIADDEAEIREELRRRIDWEGLGFSIVAEASDGETAYRRIEELNPDAAILDICMPGMDGLEVIRRARRGGTAAAW